MNGRTGEQSPYDKLNEYIFTFGVPWDERTPEAWQEGLAEEVERLCEIIGPSQGGAALDCSCGWGAQAVALAKLGWQVTATDIAESSLEIARQRASLEAVAIEFGVCDMQGLAQRFEPSFDWVISCFALYEITEDTEIQRAVDGMFSVLKPGGRCYIQLRDMDDLLADKPRWQFHGEVRTPNGRIFCIVDWEYESETHVVESYVFLREDERQASWCRWQTDAVSQRKRAIGRRELERFLATAGFGRITFLAREGPWVPYEVIAHKPDRRQGDEREAS
jgi:2-polyprenyl-3-methyl-5-hydroxy-6-metoxy-1,4-benzoquinol methylase